jgi:uncharacterized protein (TIGR02217 family)
MSEFLEERLPVTVRYGAKYGDEYKVDIVTTASGQEHRRLVNPFPVRRFTVSYIAELPKLWDQVVNVYHRAFGTFAGFRVRCLDDFSTNGLTDTPTAGDQLLTLVSDGVYQLTKQYGLGGTPLAIGLPTRNLYKPVSGTIKVAIRNTLTGDNAITAFTPNTTNGRITLPANITRSVTAITQATNAVVTVGSSHGIVVGNSVHFTGVAGMTQINSRRGVVTATASTTITVNINTAAFSAYTSGGTVNTRPQTGETVRGGCEFDIPCRFDSVLEVTQAYPTWREAQSLELVELLNP